MIVAAGVEDHEAELRGVGDLQQHSAQADGLILRVGVPQEETIPRALPTFFDNISISGGPAPARAYIEELLPDVLEGRIEPGRVFDRDIELDAVPDGYRAMNERAAIKVMIEP